MKRVVDLKNDKELNAASWQAARGAVIGAAKVRGCHSISSCLPRFFERCFNQLSIGSDTDFEFHDSGDWDLQL
jgi:hypothetical protein